MELPESIQSVSLAEQIQRALENAIIQGVLAPGDHIVESELAERFSISRAPIREAIRSLAHEGLVIIKPRKGAFVVKPDYDILSRSLDIREVLEGLVARWAATQLTADELEEIRDGLERVAREISKGKDEGYPSDVFDFHEYLLGHAGGSQLPSMLRSVRSLITLARKRSGAEGQRAQEAFDEHWRIFEALRARDGSRAEDAMRRHLARGRDNVLRALHPDRAGA